MSRERIVIQRDELYEEVWKTPLSKLGPKYMITGTALKKICKKLNVPTPPRGYWAKLQYGYKVRNPPLPRKQKKYGTPDSYKITGGNTDKGNNLVKLNGNDDDLPDELRSLSVKVPQRLRNPHPLVRNTMDYLDGAVPDEYGVLNVKTEGCLDLRVSPKALNRSLRILDAVIKCFEDLNYEIKAENHCWGWTSVNILGEDVHFSLNERVRRFDHVPTKAEIERQKEYFWDRPRPWDYEPTGKLTIELCRYSSGGLCKKWSDAKQKSVEDHVSDFVKGAYRVALLNRDRRLEQEAEQRRLGEESRKRKEEAQRLEEERRRLLDLEQQAENWNKAKNLREYIIAVEVSFSGKELCDGEKERQGRWLEWARKHADRLDPLVGKTISLQ